MAHFGHLIWTVQDSAGTAQTSKTVEVRKQGATVNGGQSKVGAGAFAVTVFDPGGIIANTDSVEVWRAGILVYAAVPATAVSATSITITATASMTLNSLDRLSCSTSLPTCYVDVDGTTTKTNPLTTGSVNGTADAYMPGGPYDLKVSGANLTTTLYESIWTDGHSRLTSEITAPGFVLDTLRTYAAGSKLFSVKNAGTEYFYVDADGSLKGATFDGAVTIAAGGLTVSATGITVASGGITVQAGGIDIEDNATFRDSILIGPSGSADCNLYRDSANVLKTDDSLTVAATLKSAGYTMFLTPPTIDLTGLSTLTIPAAGTAFFVTATGSPTITTISGGTAGQLVAFIAKTGTTTITFSNAGNIVHNYTGANGPPLGTTGNNATKTVVLAFFDGTKWYLMSAGGNG